MRGVAGCQRQKRERSGGEKRGETLNRRADVKKAAYLRLNPGGTRISLAARSERKNGTCGWANAGGPAHEKGFLRGKSEVTAPQEVVGGGVGEKGGYVGGWGGRRGGEQGSGRNFSVLGGGGGLKTGGGGGGGSGGGGRGGGGGGGGKIKGKGKSFWVRPGNGAGLGSTRWKIKKKKRSKSTTPQSPGGGARGAGGGGGGGAAHFSIGGGGWGSRKEKG